MRVSGLAQIKGDITKSTARGPLTKETGLADNGRLAFGSLHA